VNTPVTVDLNRSPFHEGERALQERVGVRERLETIGRKTIRRLMPDQHRELFEKLPYLLAGALDERRRPWATMLVGRPGFITSPDPATLRVAARPAAGDPLAHSFGRGEPVGLLGIELSNRRRNRMNGLITDTDAHGFTVKVGQSFGNCPKYIQLREPVFVVDPAVAAAPRPVLPQGPLLSDEARTVIERADTFFIATAAAPGNTDSAHGVDVSHRGGRPGFVRVGEQGGQTILTAPDFLGNFHFNTFGNLAVNPRAGVLFVDFASGGLLSLTGQAEVIWSGPERDAFPGAERLLRFAVEAGMWMPAALPLRWSEAVLSPHLASTGTWADVA
jgi:hypothetical protein